MPPYRLLWLEVAERHYLDLPEDARELVDERLAQLEHDPLGLPDAVYDAGPISGAQRSAATASCCTPLSPSRRP